MPEPTDNFPKKIPFDRTPWRFFFEANEEEKRRQQAWQKHLAQLDGVELVLGSDVFISEMATVGDGKLHLGNRSYIAAEAQVGGGEVIFGEHCTLNAGGVVRGKVTLGDGVRIATGAQILGFNHGTEDLEKPIYKQPHTKKGIVIGDDVWVGANVVVLDGIKVGSHCILAAGAIVTKDVPEWSVMGGNPARIIKDRRSAKAKNRGGLGEAWTTFKNRVGEETVQVLSRCMDPDHGSPRDLPGEKERLRPWCDMVEIAAMTGSEIPGWSREHLIQKIRGFQDPVTGLVRGPYGEGGDWEKDGGIQTKRMNDGHSAYGVMSAGYALECMGTHLEHPVSVARDLRHEDLHQHLASLNWKARAWGAGAWVDHYATAMAFNSRYHGGAEVLPDLFGWLLLHADPMTGMWGIPTPAEGMLQPVNGFYRLTRGSFAQWGVPLPYPERSIDTVLAHSNDQRHVAPGKPTACTALDIIHPLWLCLRQTSYRRKDCEIQAGHWLERILPRWVPGEGFSFGTHEGATPGLQGTEMWLSIAWLCADLLGLGTQSGYRPRGVHRPEVWAKGLGNLGR